MNSTLLKNTITETELRPEYFASRLDISLRAWRDKVDGTTEFRISEAKKLKEILGLNNQAFMKIFFD